MRKCFLLSLLFLTVMSTGAFSQSPKNTISLTVTKHKPCNIFNDGSKIFFNANIKCQQAGKGQIAYSVRNYFNKELARKTLPVSLQAQGDFKTSFKIGVLPCGYYELRIAAQLKTAKGEVISENKTVRFAVAQYISRSAKEVREGGYRFGLKMWHMGRAPKNNGWDTREVVKATTLLGLQWTRDRFNLQSQKLNDGKIRLGVMELMENYPMNVILKIESFPIELFDTKRYGSLEEWTKRNGAGWAKMTVPKKKGYQAWLKKQIEKIPPEQKVFEIWNEPFNKMAPEDFAEICQYVVEVVRQVRPDAILGPNLKGKTSEYKYDAKVIKAGGLKGMDMVSLHPYSGSENREWMRDYKNWLKEKTGRNIDIYVTEYGAHSTPKGPAKKSEEEQARDVVRQSLSLYAEDVKAFTPHWMGQAERDQTYREDWYGFYTLAGEPKPVLIAQATCARMIDGKEYLGDLWFGKGVGAMLFAQNGDYTLALFTKDGERTISIDCSTEEATLTDIMGKAQEVKTVNGSLELKVTEDIQYVSGLSKKMAATATKKLNPERWPKPEEIERNARKAKYFAQAPVMNGNLDDWKDAAQYALINPKVAGNDASGTAYLGWDAEFLYLAVDMRDNQVINTQALANLYREDSIELFISTEIRDDDPGYGPNDFQFFITPTSNTGKPQMGRIAERASGEFVEVKGGRFYAGKGGKGWIAEIAIPWAYLGGFQAKAGEKIALEVRVNDADTTHKRFAIDIEDLDKRGTKLYVHEPTTWSELILEK